MDAILAIDAGTTGITALLVDSSASVIAQGYREFPQHFPADGWVEHDLSEMWTATLAATREALARADVTITAIGITNQRETVCFWDRETLGAPRRAIVWQDRRTAAMCEALRESGHEPRVQELTGLRLDPYFSGTKLAWVREHDPRTWAHVGSGRVAVGTVDSYLIARMTRGLHHVTDPTNASRTLLYDLHTGAWSPELCDLLGVPMHALPEIVPSYGVCGRSDAASFLGINAPIAGIAGDQQAALVGQAGFAAGAAKCTYGTGSFLLVHTGRTPARSSHGLLTTVALGHPDGSRDYALEGSVFVTGAAVQWLRDGLGIISSAAEIEELAASVPDSGGVVFVPALTGLGAPDWDPGARGLIIGITRGTTKAHLARAALEAIAFSVSDVVDLMAADGGVPLARLAIDGGAAANDLLCQLQATAAQVIVDRSAQLQTTGLGAAFLAGLGTGVWPSTRALATTRASSGIFDPGPADAEAHRRWRDAVSRSRSWAR
ncbi:MAG: FGGY family carbohydrate kinase [Candidatus Nanopelagicales bacterium]